MKQNIVSCRIRGVGRIECVGSLGWVGRIGWVDRIECVGRLGWVGRIGWMGRIECVGRWVGRRGLVGQGAWVGQVRSLPGLRHQCSGTKCGTIISGGIVYNNLWPGPMKATKGTSVERSDEGHSTLTFVHGW